jgi:hypothetical protein
MRLRDHFRGGRRIQIGDRSGAFGNVRENIKNGHGHGGFSIDLLVAV